MFKREYSRENVSKKYEIIFLKLAPMRWFKAFHDTRLISKSDIFETFIQQCN